MALTLREACSASRCAIVVGKGGVGKTTTAGALAVALADTGEPVHLISTDPAHSTADLFGLPADMVTGRPCGPLLLVESFDAAAFAASWSARARPHLAELIGAGTWLDDADVDGVLEAALPGIDEVMAALRLAELARGSDRIVVDTAPAGHTLRLLDAGAVVESWLGPLRAMAQKAAVVASRLTGVPARLSAERFLDGVDDELLRFRALLADAAFLVVERDEPGIRAVTDVLLAALARRSLRVAAIVRVGVGRVRTGLPSVALPEVGAIDASDPCGALRALAAGAPAARERDGAVVVQAARGRGEAGDWFGGTPMPLLLFAGKGGVGKSTCAAAAACAVAGANGVLLVSTDPAGSLAEVLATGVGSEATPVAPGLDALQIDAAEKLASLKARYRDDIRALLERVGLDASAALDRAVMESLFDLAPPGIDELVAMIELTGIQPGDRVVLDAAPTGHFLRLLEMPALARGWLAALMRLLVRYGAGVAGDDVVQRVTGFSRHLRELTAMLVDHDRTGAVIVTLDEPMVYAESVRLRSSLTAAGVGVAAVVVNRARSAPATRMIALAGHGPLFVAPEMPVSLTGVDALRDFLERWERVV